MALIICKECGQQVSDKADKCPHCGAPVNENLNKKYCKHCGAQIDKECLICPKCGKQVEQLPILSNRDNNIIVNNNNSVVSNFGNMISPKSRLIALLFCIFLGWLGIHRFYVGKVGTAILMMILMCTGIGEIWLFIDFLLILLGSFRDSNGFWLKKW